MLPNYCLHCHQRRLHGQSREQSPSPFLSEIPEGVREPVRVGNPGAYRGGYDSGPYWRERPLGQRGYGDRYSGGGGAFRAAPSRAAAAPRGTPPRPQPVPPQQPKRNDPANGVLSFFKDEPVRFDPAAIRAASAPQATARPSELKRGQRVRHEQFGDGVILTMEGSGPDAKLTVYFDHGVGSKKFIAKFARLTRI